jgi:hypothetical protein
MRETFELFVREELQKLHEKYDALAARQVQKHSSLKYPIKGSGYREVCGLT